jgi:prepilin-type N-terminal cleavage/methylation domain-containing protein
MNSNKGFTLIEVFLVAMLVGVVLMAIFSAYVGGAKIWRAAGELGLSEDRRFYIGMEKIHKELRGYMRGYKDIPFEGGETELTFPRISGSRIKEITYRFDGNRRAFTREAVTHSESLKEKMKKEKAVLFDADSVELAYFIKGKDEAETEGMEWASDFSAEEGEIPAAIRVDIKRNKKMESKYVFLPQ